MRKCLGLLAVIVAALLLFSGCGAEVSPSAVQQGPEFSAVEQPTAGAEIALLLQNAQKENAQSQAIWAVLNRFAGENGTTSGQYLTEGENQDAAFAALELAVKGGAKLVLVVGQETALMLERAPMRYPDVQFVFVDARGSIALEENSAAIDFAWSEAGWLAGYAAVYERILNLGYWNAEDKTAMEYAAGFALGAEAAAEELELGAGMAKLWGLQPPASEGEADWKTPAQTSFSEGMQLLLINLQEALEGARLAARQTEGKLITFGLPAQEPKANEFLNVILDCRPALQNVLSDWKSGRFPGGETILADVANAGVGVAFANETEYFTPKRYEIAQGKFAGSEFSVKLLEAIYPQGAEGVPQIAGLPLRLVKIRGIDEAGQSSGASVPAAETAAPQGEAEPPQEDAPTGEYQQAYTVPQDE